MVVVDDPLPVVASPELVVSKPTDCWGVVDSSTAACVVVVLTGILGKVMMMMVIRTSITNSLHQMHQKT